jgi:hypothetical protein
VRERLVNRALVGGKEVQERGEEEEEEEEVLLTAYNK